MYTRKLSDSEICIDIPSFKLQKHAQIQGMSGTYILTSKPQFV